MADAAGLAPLLESLAREEAPGVADGQLRTAELAHLGGPDATP